MKNNKYIIISGATATGKTSTSIDIARYIKEKYKTNSEVVNFDSLLFYSELNIGTAKPTKCEQDGVKHHMVDISSINTPLNASEFIIKANEIIKNLFNKGSIPILVGGSAFYIRALIKGMIQSKQNRSPSDSELPELKRHKSSLENIVQYLKDNDPQIFNYFHPNDEYRLTRALEYQFLNNSKYSVEIDKTNKNRPYDFDINNKIDGTMLHLYLEIDKETHLKIIKDRTLKMIENGLIDEVKKILERGYSKSLKPLGSIGYKETINFIENNKNGDVDELAEQIFISTRQLAKSQKTFFRKITPKQQISPLTDNRILFNYIDDFMK